MKSSDLLNFLPAHLRSEQLFIQFTNIFSKALSKQFNDDLNKGESVYDISSEYHDPDYIIQILGGSKVLDVLNNNVDKRSLEVMLPKLWDIRGTEQALDTILRLSKINYISFYLVKERDGCKYLTIVSDNNTYLTKDQITSLNNLVRMFLPMCIKLRGLTNCSSYRQDSDNGKLITELDISSRRLDDNYILDESIMDRSEGMFINDSNIVVKLCNIDSDYANVSLNINMNAYTVTKSPSESVVMFEFDNLILDKELALDQSIINTPFAIQEVK